jgi:hypothetical protein
MKYRLLLPSLALMICLQGCTTDIADYVTTNGALYRSTLAQGRTMTDIDYTMLLDNVAMFRELKTNALPWHLAFLSGDITIKDTLTGGDPNFSYAWDPISRSFGASASRSWQENWTAVPVVDGPTLERLTGIYRNLADVKWIMNGRSLADDEGASGYYGFTRVWVSKANLGHLTTATISVLAAASSAGVSGPLYQGITPSFRSATPLLPSGPIFEIR